MERISIRLATMEDLPDILQLYGQPDLDNGKVLPLIEAREIFEKIHAHPNYKIYVGCSGDRIVGTFALLIMDNLVHMGARSAIIEDLVVAAEWQRMGIGMQMLHFAMQRCREARCYKMVVSSSVLRISAHRFYKDLGFEHHGYSFVVKI